jgi:vacuolar-type H+-ATPase subunit I/STV1
MEDIKMKLEDWIEAYKSEDGLNFVIPNYKIDRVKNVEKKLVRLKELVTRLLVLEAEKNKLEAKKKGLKENEFEITGYFELNQKWYEIHSWMRCNGGY